MSKKLPTVIRAAEYKRVVYALEVENTTTPDEVLNPDFWVHVANTLKAGDRIEVHPSNRSWYAEYYVLAAAKNWAKLVKLQSYVLIDMESKETPESPYVIEWKTKDKWRVKKANEILSKDHDSKEEAEAWLKDHKEELAK